MEGLTSSKDITALERSAITEFYAPGRSGGIQVSGAGSNWTYGVGFFEANGDKSDDFDDTAITGRATFNPIKNDDALIHIGAAFSVREDTNKKTDTDLYSLELAGAMGPLHAQAEYMDATIDDDNSLVNIDKELDGYYIQVGYIITGETRPYKNGVFKRVKPANDGGAWEVVLRHEDGDGHYKDIGAISAAKEDHSKGSQTTIGVNWYVNNNVRFGLSYMDGENETFDIDGDEFRARAQLTF